ncbi:hypothetical protein [Aureimonas sp. ME7]|uniref:hypothetical protein n=1 Tax=Aureimonas sp. ME7 TaxID=2744252 RepID=UPI0015F5CCA9|nr:hypothetical protein [Aureimonas sp. ME7]
MKGLAAVAFLACAIAAPAYAQSGILLRDRPDAELIESYVAFISRDDLYNSSGRPLTRPWQVIRQDRANYHAYGIRDRGDQGDTFFSSAVNRGELENMLARGSISRAAAARVMRGNVFVVVQIYGRGDIGEFVRVDVE